jgi:hypothetical protein
VRHLDQLPEHLRPSFCDRVLDGLSRPVTIDYVRLNMLARNP